MFFFYFFLKKVEMFFDPDAALARALSFAVMLGLAACNTFHFIQLNYHCISKPQFPQHDYTLILKWPLKDATNHQNNVDINLSHFYFQQFWSFKIIRTIISKFITCHRKGFTASATVHKLDQVTLCF